jgi:hypothetical protein
VGASKTPELGEKRNALKPTLRKRSLRWKRMEFFGHFSRFGPKLFPPLPGTDRFAFDLIEAARRKPSGEDT